MFTLDCVMYRIDSLGHKLCKEISAHKKHGFGSQYKLNSAYCRVWISWFGSVFA